jgi:hypothetical protein
LPAAGLVCSHQHGLQQIARLRPQRRVDTQAGTSLGDETIDRGVELSHAPREVPVGGMETTAK